MKNKKKLIIFIGLGILLGVTISVILLSLFVGEAKSPEGMTKDFLKKYQKLDSSVVKTIKYEYDDKLTPTQLDKYKEIIKDQYEKLEYTILEVKENKEECYAYVRVEFTVEDLSSAMEMANSYIDVNGDKFEDDYATVDYKLSVLDERAEEQTYTVEFNFYYEDGKWYMYDLSEADLKKFRGTY